MWSNTLKFSNMQTTLLFTLSGKNVKDISNLPSIDLSSVATSFKENDLLMNLKQGKTEALLRGTS